MRSYACEDRSRSRPGPPDAAPERATTALSFAKGLVLADEELEVHALFVGELEEHLLAFGVLETLAIALEELVRSALAADADEERLLVVDALAQLLGALGEEAAGGALEEEERRARLELRVLCRELAIPLLQRAEMFLFFLGELMEDRAAARVLGHAGRPRVELETAALGGNRHPQRVTREHQLRGRAVYRRRLLAGPAFVAGPEDLDHLLRRREIARRRDFLHQRLDVRAQEFGRPVTRVADEMKVTRMAVRRFEA